MFEEASNVLIGSLEIILRSLNTNFNFGVVHKNINYLLDNSINVGWNSKE